MTSKYHPHYTQSDAGKMYGAVQAALQGFERYYSEITHAECSVKPSGEITTLFICACLAGEGGEVLRDWYKRLAVFIEKTKDGFPCQAPLTYIGFNYDKPGLIEIKKDSVMYFADRDLLDSDLKPKSNLYRVIDIRTVEKEADKGFKLWKKFHPEYLQPDPNRK